MNKKLSFLIIILLYIILAAISLIRENIHLDEKGFHLPTLELFSNNDSLTAVTNHAYKSASTPLPYIIASLLLKILNLSLFTPTNANPIQNRL